MKLLEAVNETVVVVVAEVVVVAVVVVVAAVDVDNSKLTVT